MAHSGLMSAIRTILALVSDALAADGTMMRIRFRATYDQVVTLGIAVLAVGLAVGYQVLGRLGRRSNTSD